MNRIFALGDVHGHINALRAVIDAAELAPEDTLVGLGDYIDYGPSSNEVMTFLMELDKNINCHWVMGNHEELLIAAVEKPEDFESTWLRYGGQATLDSYQGKVSSRHLSFLKQKLIPFCSTENYLFVHAGVEYGKPLSLQNSQVLRWDHSSGEIESQPFNEKIVVKGHTPQKSGMPMFSDGTILLDTNIAAGGWLSLYDLLAGKLYQANQEGNLRTFSIECSFELAS